MTKEEALDVLTPPANLSGAPLIYWKIKNGINDESVKKFQAKQAAKQAQKQEALTTLQDDAHDQDVRSDALRVKQEKADKAKHEQEQKAAAAKPVAITTTPVADEPSPAPDETPAAQFTDADPKNDLKRDYVFTVDAKSPQAGRDLDLKIAGENAPWVSFLNNGSKYIHFRGYRFSTRSKGIRDFLRAGIASGVFDMIKEDVQVTVRCAVPGCTFVSSQRGSLGQQELTAHFMARHAGTGDEDGED